jgi:DNA excision repair protein ERCC-2
MEWDLPNRTLSLSVGELSRTGISDASAPRSGRWRADLGTAWHAQLRQSAENEERAWRFEVPVAGELVHGQWRFILSGRIDQLLSEGPHLHLREVKSTATPLPADPLALRNEKAAHFHQVALYTWLLRDQSRLPSSELLYVEITTGLTQTVPLQEEDFSLLGDHLDQVVTELEDRRRHQLRLRQLRIPPPFSSLREGQAEAREALSESLARSQIVGFEAPTGFGKTAFALEAAAKALASGTVDRIIALTCKTTGQAPLVDHMTKLREAEADFSVRTLALRSRADLTTASDLDNPLSTAEIVQRWRSSGCSASEILDSETPDLQRLNTLASAAGIPAWAVLRFLMAPADLWVGDINYGFAPGIDNLFHSVPAYHPGRTFLIVDEVHNLAERVCGACSLSLTQNQCHQALTDLQLNRFNSVLIRQLDRLLSLLKKSPPSAELDPDVEADYREHLAGIAQTLAEAAYLDQNLQPDTSEWLYQLQRQQANIEDPELDFLFHSPKRGSLHLNCLSADRRIARILGSFHKVLLLSATLSPWSSMKSMVGKNWEPTAFVEGEAPWLQNAFSVVVDARPDTRFRKRNSFLRMTAETIKETLVAIQEFPLAVFFPSYQYAAQVHEYFSFVAPQFRIDLQPKGLVHEEQVAFLDAALAFADAVFLVLGSRFSEGIDSLGGRVHRAIIVSPALPEVNDRQRALEARFSGNRNDAFRQVYIEPGMRKIIQAVGRLVRDPGQTARILLHCQRFCEPAYSKCLPVYLKPEAVCHNDLELARYWLNPKA